MTVNGLIDKPPYQRILLSASRKDGRLWESYSDWLNDRLSSKYLENRCKQNVLATNYLTN